MDNVKTRTSAKADKKGLKRRAGEDPLEATIGATSVPATSGAHTSPMEVDDAGRGATSASSGTARAPMDVDSATVKGPSTTEGAMPIPRELANDILAAIPLLPNATSLMEHLVEFLSEWIVSFVEPAREITSFFSTKKIFGSGPSGKTFTLQQH